MHATSSFYLICFRVQYNEAVIPPKVATILLPNPLSISCNNAFLGDLGLGVAKVAIPCSSGYYNTHLLTTSTQELI
jgi:hypothetical protein